jgi:hypothetical protein
MSLYETASLTVVAYSKAHGEVRESLEMQATGHTGFELLFPICKPI